MHTGAVAFCVGLRSVLCVRKAGSAKWQFPHLQAAEADEKSAATAVQQLTGLDVSASFTADYVEAKSGDDEIRLFIAAGVREDLPSTSEAGGEWEEARWLSFNTLQSGQADPLLGDSREASERELLQHFLPFVTKWHDRHKHTFQQEEISQEEAWRLGQAAMFRRRTWTGPLPREILSSWCRQNEVAEAFYTIVSSRHPHFTCASCVLPHRAAVITPEWGFLRPEDAMDNAALAAIIFLERGLSPETDRCVICSTSEQPQLGPLLYTADRKDLASNLANRSAAITAERERLQLQWQALDTQLTRIADQQALLNGQNMDEDEVMTPEFLSTAEGLFPGPHTSGVLPVFDDVPQQGKAKRQKTTRAPAKPVPPGTVVPLMADKHPIQMLKELLDRKKWPQASVTFSKAEGQDGHTCQLEIPNCGVVKSATAKSQKLAKNAAACDALQALQRLGLIPDLSLAATVNGR